MKDIKITELLCAGFEAHEAELCEKINANEEHNESKKEFEEIIHSLETETMLKLDETSVRMEVIAMDIAFDEGFKLAVRLILSSMS